MQIIGDYKKCPENAKGSVIALGNFDGFHRGHQAIINRTIKIASDSGRPSAVMSFEPHPVSFFKPDSEKFRLTDAKKKAALLKKAGIDLLFLPEFNKEFAAIEAKDFIREILIKHLKVSHIVTGYDFIFGRKRSGNAAMLHEMAEKYGYGYTEVSPVGDEEVFSSTSIRKYLRSNNLQQAAHILGRNYTISGIVERGDNRGKSLGFPTINVNCGSFLSPAKGVYAVKVKIADDNKIYNAVANIGNKPTFDGVKEEIEVHIFDFDKDIYSSEVEVEFISYIRDEKKFNGAEDLINQIKQDCLTAREILK